MTVRKLVRNVGLKSNCDKVHLISERKFIVLAEKNGKSAIYGIKWTVTT